MTLEQINELKIEDCREILEIRLTARKIEITEENLSEVLVEYKAELAEICRKNDLNVRWRNIYDQDCGVPAFRILKKDVANAEKYIQDLIANKTKSTEAEEFMTQLEAENEKIKKENEEKEKNKSEKKEKVIKDIDSADLPDTIKDLLKTLV